MLNIGRRDPRLDTKDIKETPLPLSGALAQSVGTGTTGSHGLPPVAPRPVPPTPNVTPATAREPVVPHPPTAPAAPSVADTPGSKLIVGPNIKLKGVEIADCDTLIVEGHVEATVNSKAMQIANSGTLKGNASIDVAEIQGEFTGELTVHKRLVIHATGRVSGTIRYGKLVVAEGGELCGDVKRIGATAGVETTNKPGNAANPAAHSAAEPQANRAPSMQR